MLGVVEFLIVFADKTFLLEAAFTENGPSSDLTSIPVSLFAEAWET